MLFLFRRPLLLGILKMGSDTHCVQDRWRRTSAGAAPGGTGTPPPPQRVFMGDLNSHGSKSGTLGRRILSKSVSQPWHY